MACGVQSVKIEKNKMVMKLPTNVQFQGGIARHKGRVTAVSTVVVDNNDIYKTVDNGWSGKTY